MKTIKTISLTIAMLFFSLVSSAYDFEVDGIYYNILSEMDKTVEVTSGDVKYTDDVTIPSTVDYNSETYSVTGIGTKAFYMCSSLTYIDIAESVTSIGNRAFQHCTNLSSVVIPSGVTSIEEETFWDCGSMTSISIPNSVTNIGNGAFAFCDALVSVVIPNNVTSIGESAFEYCLLLTSVLIPNSVTSIGNGAFQHCTNLSSVVIPSGVTSIGCSPFAYCDRLSSIVVDKDNPVYDSREGCNAIIETATNTLIQGCVESIIPNGVVAIASSAFSGLPGPANIVIPNTVTSIGVDAFYNCHGLVSVSIPESIVCIESRAFEGCTSLSSIAIPCNVTDIEDNAFNRCSSLVSIVVSKDNPVYDSRDNCNAIMRTSSSELVKGCISSDIPEDTKSIGRHAFYGCHGLVSLEIPAGVTAIGECAFGFCRDLMSIVLPETVTKIDHYALLRCNKLTSVNIPSTVTDIGYGAFESCSAIGSAIIPYGVLCIERSTFAMCTNLTFVNIPNSVTIIEEMAFERCTNLSSITIPEHVTSIGERAFYDCRSLSSVTSLSTTAPILNEDTIQGIFEYISSDAVLYIPSGSEADYEAKGWYEYFSRVATIGSEEHIADGTLDEYVNESERGPIDIHYTRTLPNQAWNPLYVPFEIPCSVLSGKYDVAYINSLHSYDYDDDGTIDKMTVEVVKIPSGTLKANYPYLIRARSDADRSMHLVLEDATLYRTEENGIDCSSVYNLFEVKGTYSRKSSAELGGSLAISTSGAWQPIPEGSSLGPFRLYLTISSRGDSPLKIEPSALSRVNIVVSGEDDSATGIDGVEQGSASQTNPSKIYDLSGRRVHTPSRGGVYMVNGRKVVY